MNISQIRHEASVRLKENKIDFSKLVLYHTAITAAVSLLLMLVSWVSQHIAPEGGLSNMGTQNLLATGQTLIQLANMVAVPFWNAGLIFSALQLLDGHHYSLRTLTEGFKRFGAIASSMLIRGVIYFFVTTGSFLITSLLVSLLPLPASLADELTAFVQSPTLPMSGNVKFFYIACMAIWSVSFMVLLIPKLYLHRLVEYRIMDKDPCGGMQAILHSRYLMKGKRRKLLLLDLGFWWFYLLEFGISMLSMGSVILPELPIGSELASWLFPIAALLLQLVLYYLAKPKLAITYAVFYQHTLAESVTQPQTPESEKLS